MRFFFFFMLLFVASSCRISPHELDVRRWEKQAKRITIYRDDFGVPHIYAPTDADAVFGMLYAQCEDDFMRVERNYIWATGRLAEVEGESALYSDVRANLFMTREEAIKEYERAPDWLKKLCVAFADGINYYLYTHPEVSPALITRFEPWMALYFSEGSIGGDIESIATRKIQEFYEKNGLVASLDEGISEHNNIGDTPVSWDDTDQLQMPTSFSMLEEPQGSNGFAISGKLTDSGNAMLLINPHTSFYFRGEIHVVSEEGLNAYGAVTWGQFFIYQGFNEHNGWMHTSSYTDVMDEFLENIHEKKGKKYYHYGDEERELIEKSVTLSYKDDDSIRQKQFTLYRTHRGPITHAVNDQWVSTAMMWDPIKALTQSFTRTKTSNYKEFRKMMDIRTNSSNNTVYADKEGNIAFFQGNFIPKRNAAFDYTKPVEGSNPATDWQGLHTVDESITLLNPGNGWIQNCNSTPFTAAAEFSPVKEKYPYYMATEPENFRGIHAVKVLTGQRNFTLNKLIEVAYDSYLPAFEKIIPGLVSAFDESGKAYDSLKPAVEVLRNWDMRVKKESIGMTLAHYYTTRYAQVGPRPEGLTPMERINYFGTSTPHEERLQVFHYVIKQLKNDFGTWMLPWGDINRFQRLDGAIVQHFDDDKPSIPVGLASGNWGALASYGARGNQGTKKMYGTYGNSFVAVVEFGEKVSARSILAGGQNSNPLSPHFTDQAQRYADVQFKDVAYYRDDVESRAKNRYRPGEKW